VGVYVRQIHTPIALRLQLPFPYKTWWWICVGAHVRYGGSLMVQIQKHTLKNWLLIMHGWPCLSNQAMYRALHICCLGTSNWDWEGMCFVTLLVFVCVPIPWELKPVVGKSTIGSVTCMMSRTKSMSFYYALAQKCAIWEGDMQKNLQTVLIELTLETQAFYFDRLLLRQHWRWGYEIVSLES